MQTETITNNATVELTESELRLLALAKSLGIEPCEVGGDAASFEYSANGAEYIVLNGFEADDMAREYIEDSLWAFNASFLAEYTELPEEIFIAMQDKREGSNDTIRKVIERADGGMNGFVEQAIEADGRGHFINSYDGEEDFIAFDGCEYFIYRTN